MKYIGVIFILLHFCFFGVLSKDFDIYDLIWPICKEFHLKQINLVYYPRFQDVILLQRFSKNNLTVNVRHKNSSEIEQKRNYLKQNSFIFVSSEQFRGNFSMELQSYIQLSKTIIVVVLEDQTFELLMNSLKVQINKEVYLFKVSTSQLFETYDVNNIKVKRFLGQIEFITKKFVWQENMATNLIIRRSDFQGLTVKASSNWSGSNFKLDLIYKKMAPYYPNNDTYLINGYTTGVVQDVLEILQQRLNFSTLLYLRGDGVWGNVFTKPNGSIVGTGLVGDLYYNRYNK